MLIFFEYGIENNLLKIYAPLVLPALESERVTRHRGVRMNMISTLSCDDVRQKKLARRFDVVSTRSLRGDMYSSNLEALDLDAKTCSLLQLESRKAPDDVRLRVIASC